MELDDAGECVETKKCVITSQNHGYAVVADELDSDWHVWFKNANDGSVEGIKHKSKPFWGVQFHPEANPGPTDTAWVFDLYKQEKGDQGPVYKISPEAVEREVCV